MTRANRRIVLPVERVVGLAPELGDKDNPTRI